MRSANQAVLGRGCVSPDSAAFELVVRQHGRRLARMAMAVLRDDAEAEDALQEAYVRAFKAVRAFRGDASLVTWLTRIVLNECLGRLRQIRRRKTVPVADVVETDGPADFEETGPVGSVSPQDVLTRRELCQALERCIAELPPHFRDVFVLRAVEDLSVASVARRLGLPVATVRSRHWRARGLLQEALAAHVQAQHHAPAAARRGQPR